MTGKLSVTISKEIAMSFLSKLFSRKPRVCRHCGAENERTNIWCISCGRQVGKRPPDNAILSCPMCGDVEAVLYGGQRATPHSKDALVWYQCPHCENRIGDCLLVYGHYSD